MKVKRCAAELHNKPSQTGRWQRAGVDAVFKVAAMPSRAHFNATDEAIEQDRQDLRGDFQSEEIAAREPQG